MPDTPPTGSLLPYVSDATCLGRHERSNAIAHEAKKVAYANERRLDGLTGIDGGVGRVGELEADMRKVSTVLENLVKQTERSGARVAAIYAAITFVSASIAVAVIKLVFNGG